MTTLLRFSLVLALFVATLTSAQELGMAHAPAISAPIALTEIGSFEMPSEIGQIQSAEVGTCAGVPCLYLDIAGIQPNVQMAVSIPEPGGTARVLVPPHSTLHPLWEQLKTESGWDNKYVVGGPVQIGPSKFVSICGVDWYMPSSDYASHCWYDLETGEVRGPYHIGKRGDPLTDRNVHGYLARIPQEYADRVLDAQGKPWCLTGFRKPGVGRQVYRRAPAGGPSLVAFNCAWPEAAPGSAITEIRPAFYLWHPIPFSTASGELSGNLRLPSASPPFHVDDWPFNSAGTMPSDITVASLPSANGEMRTFVFMSVRQGSQWHEYHHSLRPLFDCIHANGPDACDDIEVERYRMCVGRDLIPGTSTRCAPAAGVGYHLHWDHIARDPQFEMLGPAYDSRFRIDECNLDRGYGAGFPADEYGRGGGMQAEIWAWDADEFFRVELDEQSIRDPANLPQPVFRKVMGRGCLRPLSIAYDASTQRLYWEMTATRGAIKRETRIFEVSLLE